MASISHWKNSLNLPFCALSHLQTGWIWYLLNGKVSWCSQSSVYLANGTVRSKCKPYSFKSSAPWAIPYSQKICFPVSSQFFASRTSFFSTAGVWIWVYQNCWYCAWIIPTIWSKTSCSAGLYSGKPLGRSSAIIPKNLKKTDFTCTEIILKSNG